VKRIEEAAELFEPNELAQLIWQIAAINTCPGGRGVSRGRPRARRRFQ
jgi:hypothetical protein